MATSLSNLLALLSLDETGYVKGLQSSRKHTETFAEKLTGTFNKIGGAVVGGLAVAGGAAAGFLASSIEPASDLEETISKTKVVFGEYADAMLRWGKDSASALGLSENAALSAAGTYGNLFRAMDISENQSVRMSAGLVNLAADLASFNNMDPTEVLDKLRAGISGESEPLKSLGVNINQATIAARALEMGLVDLNVDELKVTDMHNKLTKASAKTIEMTNKFGSASQQATDAAIAEAKIQEQLEKALGGTAGELTAAAKAQATFSLIMEQTSLAQGDFARTSGGLANQQRILKAQFENIKATVGSGLLPVITKLATTVSEYLARPETAAIIEKITNTLGDFAQRAIEAFPEVIANIQGAFNWLKEHEGVVVAIFAVLGMAVTAWAVTTAIAAWTAMAPFLPIIAVIALLGAAVYLLYEAWTNNWGGIRDKTMAFVEWIRPYLEGLWQGILFYFEYFKAQFQTLFEAFSLAFQGDWRGFGEKLREIWDRAWNTLKELASKAWDAIVTFFRTTDWGQVGRNILTGIARGITAGISIITEAARNAASAALEAAKGFLGISSPSRVFELQVGHPMAAGVAAGWERGLAQLLTPSLGALQPATASFAPAGGPLPSVAAATARGGGAGAGADEALLREIRQLLRDLPQTIARVTRDERLRRAG